MTVSPKKHTSYFTSSTTNRGVEAKEVEIADIRLDTSSQPSSQATTDRSRTSSAPPPSPPSRDDSASYIQVLVQKQRRRKDADVAQRLPRPSSPVESSPSPPAANVRKHLWSPPPADLKVNTKLVHSSAKEQLVQHLRAAPKDPCGVCSMWPDALLTCSALAALHQSCGAAQAAAREPPPVPTAGTRPLHATSEKGDKTSLWQKMRSITKEDLDPFDGPERLDIYRFESESATLIARGVPPTQLERVVRRSVRPAVRLLGELLAAPRLLAALPAALLLLMLRSALTPVRDTIVGLGQTLSDFVLKPALALTFNALLQPVLVCAGQATRALREALHPLTLALADAVEPPARLLAALRLVHIEHRCHCAHAV